MIYLITQIWLCLILAAIIGICVGWLLKGILCKTEIEHDASVWQSRIETLERERDSLKRKLSVDAKSFAGSTFTPPPITEQTVYPIEEVEGIGKSYGEKLRKINITSTRELQKKCLTEESLIEICNHMGLEDFVIKKWVSMCDLMRVPGIRGQIAELVAYAGIQSVEELANKNPQSVVKLLERTNQEQNKVKSTPDLDEITVLIKLAKNLKPVT